MLGQKQKRLPLKTAPLLHTWFSLSLYLWRRVFFLPTSASSCLKCVSWQQRSNDGVHAFHASHYRAQDLACGHVFAHFLLLEQQWPDLDGPSQLLVQKVWFVY